jgi:hypothetical protein
MSTQIKNQLLVRAIVAIALSVPALAACGDTSSPSNADLLKQAAANMKAASSYTIAADFDQEGQEIKLAGQVDVAGNSTALEVDAGAQKTSLVTIGDDVYVSTDGGTTFARVGNQGTPVAQSFSSFVQMWNNFPPDQIDKHKDDLHDGTPPTEKINGVDTRHIRGNVRDLSVANNSSDTTTAGTVDFWISTGTPYVLQMKLDGTTSGQPVQGTYNWDKFNQKFDIKAPPTSFRLNPFTVSNR